jgi:hypothetical protein
MVSNHSINVGYVLTSNGKNIYADMNLISLRTLRYTNPNAKIFLVCDSETFQALENCNHVRSRDHPLRS